MNDTKITRKHDDFFLPIAPTIKSILMQFLLSESLALVIILASMDTLAFDWMFLFQVTIAVPVLVLSATLILSVCRPWLKKLSLKKAIAAIFCLVLSSTLILSTAAAYLMDNWWLILRILLIASIVMSVILGYFYVQYNLRRELMKREQTELQARIQALQSRIRPHFLFNSMNIITSLIATDPDTAEQVVEDLSELFRASLNEVGNQVSVEEELSLCRRYMHIESLRLGDRLEINWNVGNIPMHVKIPLLTLQPILENAIYHGIQPLPKGGVIDVTVNYQAPNFYVRITNPVSNQDKRRSTKGNRIALDNIRERLDALYGESARLSAGIEGDRYITTLSYIYD